jgi:YjbE family integral membrane protein
LLIWIAVKLVQHKAVVAEDEPVRAGTSLWEAIWIIVVADVVMSFDNVMAIAGASKGHMGLVIFGLLFSIPLVVLGSGLLATMMRRFPWMIWLGSGLLGHVAGEMMLADPRARAWFGPFATRLDHFLPLALGVSLVALGWLLARGTPRAK